MCKSELVLDLVETKRAQRSVLDGDRAEEHLAEHPVATSIGMKQEGGVDLFEQSRRETEKTEKRVLGTSFTIDGGGGRRGRGSEGAARRGKGGLIKVDVWKSGRIQELNEIDLFSCPRPKFLRSKDLFDLIVCGFEFTRAILQHAGRDQLFDGALGTCVAFSISISGFFGDEFGSHNKREREKDSLEEFDLDREVVVHGIDEKVGEVFEG